MMAAGSPRGGPQSNCRILGQIGCFGSLEVLFCPCHSKHLSGESLPGASQPTDFDLHGFVGIRLIGASAAEANAVRRQLGPIEAPLDREPDLWIRFVDRLELRSPLRYLGLQDAAFTDDAFVILRSIHKSRVRVQIPLDRIGTGGEIVCERGAPAVPLLIALVNLIALSRGVLPLHASAFQYQGVGSLATGWAKGGKTEALLGFLSRGAAYVGDEWAYLTGDGQQMFGIPEPIRVWDFHLQDVRELLDRVSRGDRAKLRTLRWLVESLDLLPWNGATRVGRLGRRVQSLLESQRYVHLPPLEVFGREACLLRGVPERVFFVVSHESPEIRVTPIDPGILCDRMAHSLEDERLELRSYYSKFQFAFPGARNEILDTAAERERELLRRALGAKPTYEVAHPYPVPIPAMFDAMEPYCRRDIEHGAPSGMRNRHRRVP